MNTNYSNLPKEGRWSYFLLALSLLLLLNTSFLLAQNVNITTAAPTTNINSVTVGTVKTYTPTAVLATLDIANLLTDLANPALTEVRIEANSASGAENGDIIISNTIADIDMTRAAQKFTLIARNRVIHSVAGVGVPSIFAFRPLNVTITANGLGNEDSYVVSDIVLRISGDVTINATSINTGNNAGAFSGAIDMTSPLSPTAGTTLSITGNSAGGSPTISIVNILTRTQNVVINGTNTNTMGTAPQAVKISSEITTEGGKIDITGATSGNDVAIKLLVARLLSTGGNITLMATNTNTGANAGAIDIQGPALSPAISSVGGKITMTGLTSGNKNAITVQVSGGNIESGGGDIIISGTNTNTTGATAGGVELQNVLGSGGKIDITGTTEGQAVAVRLTGAVTSLNNDIKITGTNNNVNGQEAITINVNISTTSAGKITIEGTNKGIADAITMVTTQSITSVDGDIIINGFANNTTGTASNAGVKAGIITSAKGNITITGTSTGLRSGVSFGKVLTSGATGGNVVINGTNTSGASSLMGNSPYGIIDSNGIDGITTNAGSITLIGNSASNVPAINIGGGNIESTSGNITMTGTTTNTATTVNSAAGVGIFKKIKNNTGNITITGTTGGFAGVIIGDEVITSGSGNISINATTNSTDLLTYGVDIGSNVKSTGSGSMSIIGRHGADAGNAIRAFLQNIETAKNIFIRTTKGGYLGTGYIKSNNNGTIDICIAENGALSVGGTIPATTNSIATGAGAAISVRYGNTNITVGAAMGGGGAAITSRIDKQISNGTTTIPNGLYTNLNTGAITIRRNVTGFITSVTTPLTEANINGAVITITISSCDNVGYVPTPTPAMFELIDFPPCVTISSVTRMSDDVVKITLACDGTDFDTDFPNAKISVKTTATNPALISATVGTPDLPVTAIRECPTDITFPINTIEENKIVNTVIGALTAAGTKIGANFTYTLVAGVGDTDNASFNISTNNLRSNTAFDFETKNAYSVRVRATDINDINCFFEKQLTINVTNVNEAPTNLTLAPNSIEENKAINSEIGTLTSADLDAMNTFTYTLVAGAGDADNASFNILGDKLRSSAFFDFETKNSYTVRVRTTDQGNLFFEKQLTITIIDVNETPTNLTLSANQIEENKIVNTEIGAFASTDPDAANTFTYTLVAGVGNTDNTSFNILGDKLRSSSSFDFETKKSYTIRVRTTDQGSLFFEKAFLISVTDVAENEANGVNNPNEPPSAPDSLLAKAGSRQVTLIWEPIKNAGSYEIYMYSINTPQTLVGVSRETTFTVIGLEKYPHLLFPY